jgi:hypothetical protein
MPSTIKAAKIENTDLLVMRTKITTAAVPVIAMSAIAMPQ